MEPPERGEKGVNFFGGRRDGEGEGEFFLIFERPINARSFEFFYVLVVARDEAIYGTEHLVPG